MGWMNVRVFRHFILFNEIIFFTVFIILKFLTNFIKFNIVAQIN
jgi:hypothetical protein